MSRVSVNNINIYPFVSRDELIDFIDNKSTILVAINAEKILHSTDEIKEIINDNIGYCDGIGAVMALKDKGYKNIKKIPGCELWLNIIEKYYKEKTFYLIGAKQEVIENTVKKLNDEYNGINIVNFRNGYINNEIEKNELINDIKERKPDVVFVAMGSPKQEFLMRDMLKNYPAIYQGLGGSFDVYTGNVDRAPKWWIDNNLEFAYRLLKQPSRIKRQIHLVKFFLMLKFKRL